MEQTKHIQQIRKENLKKIIKQDFGDKIDAFANKVEKNKYVMYAMLWDIDNPNNRKISDATARAIEQKLGIDLFSLDVELDTFIEDPNYIIIPYMDIKTSNEYTDIYLHPTDRIKLPKAIFENISSRSDLIAYKISDMEMFPIYSINDIVIVNRMKQEIEDWHQYLIILNNKFLIRTLSTINDNIKVEAERNSVEVKKNSSNFSVVGIVDLEIRKKIYAS